MWSVYTRFHRRKLLKTIYLLLVIFGTILLLDICSNRCNYSNLFAKYTHDSTQRPTELLIQRKLYVNEETERNPFQHRTTLITTTTCEQRYFLLILVSSAPAHFERRHRIRQTWAAKSTLKTPRWKTIFLVAKTQVPKDTDLLLRENEHHGDLVRADFYDHYWNLTLKVLMGFEWAVRYCNFSFLLKVDDDVFVNSANVASFSMESTTPKEKLYTGNVTKSPCTRRNGKWKIHYEEFNEESYPDYCSGFGFILSYDVVVLFIQTFDILPTFRIDDVYVGMLADKLGIQPLHNNGFELWPPPMSSCTNTLVRHAKVDDCLKEIYNYTKR